MAGRGEPLLLTILLLFSKLLLLPKVCSCIRHLVLSIVDAPNVSATTHGTQRTNADWEQILHGYTAVADFPAACFYKDLMAAYPSAKIILNTRNPEEWYLSWSRTISWLHKSLLMRMFHPTYWALARLTVFEGKFEGRYEEKEFAIAVYERHIEEVKRRVPKEKLLVYENKDGWAPLCKFLQVAIPDMPFPRTNDAESFRSQMTKVVRLHALLLIVYLGLLCFALLLSSLLLIKWAHTSMIS